MGEKRFGHCENVTIPFFVSPLDSGNYWSRAYVVYPVFITSNHQQIGDSMDGQRTHFPWNKCKAILPVSKSVWDIHWSFQCFRHMCCNTYSFLRINYNSKYCITRTTPRLSLRFPIFSGPLLFKLCTIHWIYLHTYVHAYKHTLCCVWTNYTDQFYEFLLS